MQLEVLFLLNSLTFIIELPALDRILLKEIDFTRSDYYILPKEKTSELIFFPDFW